MSDIERLVQRFGNLAMRAGTANSGLCIDVCADEKWKNMKEAGKAIEDFHNQALAAAQVQARQEERIKVLHDYCPVQGRDPIPMWLAQLVYEGYRRRYGNTQNLNRIIERGGFGDAEVLILLAELHMQTLEDARRILTAICSVQEEQP